MGVTEPQATFSPCFGAAFLVWHPTKYAEVLVKRMEAAGAQAYLVNTGWNGSGKSCGRPAVPFVPVVVREPHTTAGA